MTTIANIFFEHPTEHSNRQDIYVRTYCIVKISRFPSLSVWALFTPNAYQVFKTLSFLWLHTELLYAYRIKIRILCFLFSLFLYSSLSMFLCIFELESLNIYFDGGECFLAASCYGLQENVVYMFYREKFLKTLKYNYNCDKKRTLHRE